MNQPTQPLLTLVNKLKGLLDNGLVTGNYTLTLDELSLLVRAFDGGDPVLHLHNNAVEHYQADASAMRETLVVLANEMRFYVQRMERMPPGDLAKLYHSTMEQLTATQGGAHLLQRIQRYTEEITFLKAQLVTTNTTLRASQATAKEARVEVNYWKTEAATAKAQAAKEVDAIQKELDAIKEAGHTIVAANTRHFENAQENYTLAEGLQRQIDELEARLERDKLRIELRDRQAELMEGVINGMIEYYDITESEAEEHGWTL